MRCRNIGQSEIRVNRVEIEIGRNTGGKNGLELGSKNESTTERRVVQRLDSHLVPRQNHRLRTGVPDDQRKHAVEFRQKLETILLIEVDDDLRVTPRTEAVTFGGKLLHELGVVKNLPV